MSEHQVVIVGAGPTGLLLALRLAQHGVKPRILSAASGPGQFSRAMVMHARTLEFYDQMGLADEVIAQGMVMRAVQLREGGRQVARLVLADIGAGLSRFPFALIYPQDDHERFLLTKLQQAGLQVEWNTRLTGLTQDESAAQLSLQRPDGCTETCRADYVCGCDGARSQVRTSLELAFEGGTYDHVYYVADVRLATPPADPSELAAHIGASSFALRLPVRSSGMQRLIGIVQGRPASDADRIGFDDIREDTEHLLGVKVADVNWFSTYRVHHRVAARFAVGRCFIAGDAAHVHSPAGGQGMNTGIGDAVNLSWKLAQVLQGRAAASLLQSYEPERIVFARQLVATTDRAFNAVTSPGAGGRFMRTALMPTLMPLMARFGATRRQMFRAISQVRIHYRHCDFNAGNAGRVSGGDRLPWLAANNNHAPLRSLDWQLHTFGEIPIAVLEEAARLALPVHRWACDDAALHAGFEDKAAYLVRPDGHVALALPAGSETTIGGWAQRHSLRFG
jgi:2-polyprenyl-6-methoxyphenol hydroxylase-like FAD-dependent oxidoreductase